MKEKNYLHLENIADLLWLSQFTGMQSVAIKKIEDKENPKPKDKPKIEDNEVEENTKTLEPETEEPQDDLEVHTDSQEKNSTSLKQKSAKAIKSPKKLALDHYREWEKAFKFINLKTPSKNRYELDEEKTVENIASLKVFDLVFRRVEEKSFFLTLVIDQGKTMELWEELIKNFEQMLMTMGVFARVSPYYWDTTNQKPLLYVDKKLKREVSEKIIVTDGQRNLVWVMSDCIAPAWRSGETFKSIERWSTKSFTSILQMFPKRMWMGTMLFKGEHIRLSSNSFNPLNKKLQIKPSIGQRDTLKIPIVSFDPYALQAWAKVVVNAKDNNISGIELEDLDFAPIATPPKREVTPEMRMERFYSQASYTAQRLAFYMSVLPVDLQVTRILQEEKLPQSNQAHVAEVFLGGLIERTKRDKSVHYEFYPKIREELNANISADESFEIMESMSDFVSSHLGIGFDFKALLADPNGAFEGEFALSEESLAYARLASGVLKRKGGRFYEVALGIDRKIDEVKIGKIEQSQFSLADFVTIKVGQTFSKSKYPNNKLGIPIIKKRKLQKNIEDMQFLENDNFYRINGDIVGEFHYKIDKESILITSVKEYKKDYKLNPTLFKSEENISNIYINHPLYALFTDNKYLLLEYLYFILYSEEVLSNISNYLTGSAILTLDKKDLQKLLKTVPLISLEEQRKYIVSQKKLFKPSLENNVLKMLLESSWKDEYILKQNTLKNRILLHYNKKNLALIEIKSSKEGFFRLAKESIEYANNLNIKYCYVSNGYVIYEYSLHGKRASWIDKYPSPDELFNSLFPKPLTSKELIFFKNTIIKSKSKFVEEWWDKIDRQDFKKALEDSDYVLEKIENNIYGICEVCKKNINIERLTSDPYIRYCRQCDR